MSLFLTGVQLRKRSFIVVAIPYFTFLAWYYIFSYNLLNAVLGGMTEIFYISNASFNLVVSLTLILGSSIIRRIEKMSAIYGWSVLSSIGAIFTILAPTQMLKIASYLSSGIVFGMGLLAFFTFFWDSTVPEERGRVAGSIGFVFLPIYPLFITLASALDLFGIVMLCIVLSLGTLAIKPLNWSKKDMPEREKDLREYSPEERTIVLYSIPWAIFSLINSTLTRSFSYHIMRSFSPSSQMFLTTLQVVGGSLGAMVGGVLADFLGRRLSLAFGLTLYGVSSAVSGLANSYEVPYLVFIGTGLTWGILLTLYLFVVWGDLATIRTCAHRYSIGLAIFYLTTSIGFLLDPILPQIPLAAASITSCLLIFLSNIPLILAPELLPSDFRQRIRLELYVSLAKKIRKSRKDIADRSRKC